MKLMFGFKKVGKKEEKLNSINLFGMLGEWLKPIVLKTILDETC